MSSEFTAMLDLLEMLVLSPRTGVLMALLLAAAASDIRTGRIPNWLVLGGALYAIAYNAMFPVFPRDIGIVFALEGLAMGLGAFLPLYVFRAMGAGDVKLMAMVGAFLGPWNVFAAVVATLIAGGVFAVFVALRSGRLIQMLRNVAMMCRGTALTLATGVGGLTVCDTASSAGGMPYALAIAAGTIGYLVLGQLGFLGFMWSAWS